jgi:hypothetical protein
MQTLNITKENALKAHKEGTSDVRKVLENLFGAETFKPKNIMDRIKTFQDVLDAAGLCTFPKRSDESDDEYAYRQVKLIVKVLNEGWTPNWKDDNQTKYYPWFYMDKAGSGFSCDVCDFARSCSSVGSRLCFKSSELAKYAAEQFAPIYKEFFTK